MEVLFKTQSTCYLPRETGDEVREHRDFWHPSPPPPTPGSGSRVRDIAVSPVSLGSPWNLPVFNRACTSCCLLQSTSTINQAKSLSRSSFASLSVLLFIGRQGRGEPWGLTCTCTLVPALSRRFMCVELPSLALLNCALQSPKETGKLADRARNYHTGRGKELKSGLGLYLTVRLYTVVHTYSNMQRH